MALSFRAQGRLSVTAPRRLAEGLRVMNGSGTRELSGNSCGHGQQALGLTQIQNKMTAHLNRSFDAVLISVTWKVMAFIYPSSGNVFCFSGTQFAPIFNKWRRYYVNASVHPAKLSMISSIQWRPEPTSVQFPSCQMISADCSSISSNILRLQTWIPSEQINGHLSIRLSHAGCLQDLSRR